MPACGSSHPRDAVIVILGITTNAIGLVVMAVWPAIGPGPDGPRGSASGS